MLLAVQATYFIVVKQRRRDPKLNPGTQQASCSVQAATTHAGKRRKGGGGGGRKGGWGGGGRGGQSFPLVV